MTEAISTLLSPISFQPIVQTRRWGGEKLQTVLGKRLPDSQFYGESWEVVDRHDAQSVVDNGCFQGKTVRDLLQAQGRAICGSGYQGGQFPFLIKFLDCRLNLSVQVHPNDAQAIKYHPQEKGKTEAWIIMDCEPGSMIYAGLKEGVSKKQIRDAIDNQTLHTLMKAYQPQIGDCFLIPAGTVHAIGGGNLVAEIQQPSDLTFRLYDWGAVDQDGKPRQLHIDDALACIASEGDFNPLVPACPEHNSATLPVQKISSDYFEFEIYQFQKGELVIEHADELRVLIVLEGSGMLTSGERELAVHKGGTWVLPACNLRSSIRGENGLKVCVVKEPRKMKSD